MGAFSLFCFSLRKKSYDNINVLFVLFMKRRELITMAEYILSTTTLELHNGKTPEVKGKNF